MKLKDITFSILAAFCLMACTPAHSSTGDWPDDPVQKDTTSTPLAKGKPRYIWVDAAGNFPQFANSRENIARDLKKAADCGFTDIVVDVRPTNGEVLFKTSTSEEAKFLYAWVDGVYSKVDRTATFDYLQAFIDEGHRLGLNIHAAINTMVGGRDIKGHRTGLFYRDSKKAADWATVQNTENGLKSTMDIASSSGVKFMNPANPEVVQYLCTMLTDLAAYDIDGIILDRCRYDGLVSDFSETSRQAFEKYIGVGIKNFPSDIIGAGAESLPSNRSEYLAKWLEFRAKTIYDFVSAARDAVKKVNPKIKFGVYVGGWYSTYYKEGVNWADQNFDPSQSYDWATKDYKNYGYAGLMDHMLIGAYSNPDKVMGTSEYTMQGFCLLAKGKAKACAIVAGGPDVGNWKVPSTMTTEQSYQSITKSVSACINACDGYFLFDICHLRNADTWSYVKKGIDDYLLTIN